MLNIKEVPFSSYGSFWVISGDWGKTNHLFLRNIRGGDEIKNAGRIFKIMPINAAGQQVNYKTEMTETQLKLVSSCGEVSLCISDRETVRIWGNNLGLKLVMDCNTYDNAFQLKPDLVLVNNFTYDLKGLLECFEGKMDLRAPWKDKGCELVEILLYPQKALYAALTENKGNKKKLISNQPYSHYVERLEKEYQTWVANLLTNSKKHEIGAKKAAYILWSATVTDYENLKGNAIYMSKNWMTNIWSWDNCFNAMALINAHPKLAWEQMEIIFNKQLECGILPDFVNDKTSYYSCTKPPIHGWAISYMIARNPEFFDMDIVKNTYSVLEKWTNYWLDYTNYGEGELPYYHHGNDSGWDNATIFKEGMPVSSPDLISYLILQMKCLHTLAEMLGDEDKMRFWKKMYSVKLDLLINEYWIDGKFTYFKGAKKQLDYDGDSLILFMPIILGDLLPKEIFSSLALGLEKDNRFSTEYGLATESLSSPFFNQDGYWRGPIWAPVTLMIIDGLYRGGCIEQSKDLASKFLKMANKNKMAENYNSLSGEGLRDTAFTWTSSVFLMLVSHYI